MFQTTSAERRAAGGDRPRSGRSGKMLPAPLKYPVHRSSRREEAQIVKDLRGSSINQSLVTSAATKIENTVASPGEINEQLRTLFAALS